MERPNFNKLMTYEKLDKLSETFRLNGMSVNQWYPSLAEIEKYIVPNLSNNLDFIFFILETAGSPTTEEQKKSRRILLNLFSENTTIVTEEDDFAEEAFASLCIKLRKRFPTLELEWEKITLITLSPEETEKYSFTDETNVPLFFKMQMSKQSTKDVLKEKENIQKFINLY